MCWSAEVSIKTWYFAVAGLLIGLYGGFPLHKLIFAILFSSMQLIEYYLWTYLKNPAKNQYYTLIGLVVILLEPLAALLLVPDRKIALSVGFLYIALMVVWLYQTYQKRVDEITEDRYTTVVGKNGHLYWPFVRDLNGWAGIAWFMVFFFGIFMSRDIVFILVATIALGYSIYSESYNGTYTSLWCNYSNALWVWIILWVVAKKLGLRLFRK
jgi:hypothetical protein